MGTQRSSLLLLVIQLTFRCTHSQIVDLGGGTSIPTLTTAPDPNAPVVLAGAGSTAISPFLQRAWQSAALLATEASLNIAPNHTSVSSGKGQQFWITGNGGPSDYCLSDVALTLDQYVAMTPQPNNVGNDPSIPNRVVAHVPFALATISFYHKIPGLNVDVQLPPVQLDACTIANILLGGIQKWNDKAITSQNPSTFDGFDGTEKIALITRNDNSGTTQLISQWMSESCPSVWKLGVAKVVNWPKNAKLVGGSAAMAKALSTTDYAFGYIVSNFDMNGVNATEILVANRAGHYLSSANADYSQVGKNWTLPGITASWQSVDFLNGEYFLGYPLIYMPYVILDNDLSALADGGGLLKQLLDYLLSPGVQNVLPIYGLKPLPAGILQQVITSVEEVSLAGNTLTFPFDLNSWRDPGVYNLTMAPAPNLSV